jgi:hypothetical protein
MSKNQLHQLLAVEPDKKGQANKIFQETEAFFKKRPEGFEGLIKIYTPNDDGGDQLEPETKNLITTVPERLKYNAKALTEAIDAHVSKEETNARGDVRAGLSVGSEVFGELSATTLLALEGHLTRLRQLYNEIPTLDGTRVWKKDENELPGVWKTDPEVRFRSIKEPKAITLAEATKEHPAQVNLVNVDKQVGRWETTYRSGRISSAQKSNLLERIDVLLVSVKKARSRANQAEVLQMKIGKKIFDYIHKDII